MKWLPILIALLLPLGLFAQKPSVNQDAFKKVEYKVVEGRNNLHLYISLPADHKASDRRPAVVFFFGGGWNGGTPNQFVPHALHLAEKGMVVACAEYRTKSSHKTSPYECVKDGKSAVRWLRANAASWGIDPNRLAAGGGSAGGHVAATTGVCLDGDDVADPKSTVSSVPNALLLFNPVYDNGPNGYGHERLGKQWKSISPMHNIRKGAPPTFVVLGSKDSLIPVATAEAYEQKMKAVGSTCVTHIYEGQPHGFFNFGKPSYPKTIEQLDAFLKQLGWIE